MPVVPTLDPGSYTVVPDVAVLDEFHLQRDGVDKIIDAGFLQEICDTANEREANTGDLTPAVIGHLNLTRFFPETQQPPIVGYFRNWKVGPLFDTGRMAALPDFWIKNEFVPQVKNYPRRSSELWIDRAEIDPVSLLGATVPARDLGPLPIALERDDGTKPVVRYITGDINVPDVKDDKKPTDDEKKDSSGKTVGMQQVIELLNQILAKVTGGSTPPPVDQSNPVVPPATGDVGGADNGGDLTPEELQELFGGDEPPGNPDDDRKQAAPPQQNGYSTPGPTNTTVPTTKPDVQMSRKVEDELRDLRVQLHRMKIERKVEDLEKKGVTLVAREGEIADLLLLPEQMADARLARIEKTPRAPVTQNVGGALDAIKNSVGPEGAPGDRPLTEEEGKKLFQFMREKGETDIVQGHFKFYGKYPFGHSGVRN